MQKGVQPTSIRSQLYAFYCLLENTDRIATKASYKMPQKLVVKQYKRLNELQQKLQIKRIKNYK